MNRPDDGRGLISGLLHRGDDRGDDRGDGRGDDRADDRGTDRGDGLVGTGSSQDLRGDGVEVVRSEEQLRVGTETERLGSVRAVKHVDVEQVSSRVERGTEHAETERVGVDDAATDSGEVETLPDGSLSIPVFEEQIVVTKRLVVRERVIVRKHTVYEEHVVTADLQRERLEVVADDGVVVVDDQGGVRS